VSIPQEVSRILQLGPKFCFDSKKIPTDSMVMEIEHVINNSGATEKKKDEVRHRVALQLKNIRTKSGNKRTIRSKNRYRDNG